MISEKSPESGEFEKKLRTLQLHQILKPIRLLTRTKFLLLYIYLESKLIHIKFLAILKDIFAPSLLIIIIILITTSMRGES